MRHFVTRFLLFQTFTHQKMLPNVPASSNSPQTLKATESELYAGDGMPYSSQTLHCTHPSTALPPPWLAAAMAKALVPVTRTANIVSRKSPIPMIF